jgi:hypothetical protein
MTGTAPRVVNLCCSLQVLFEVLLGDCAVLPLSRHLPVLGIRHVHGAHLQFSLHPSVNASSTDQLSAGCNFESLILEGELEGQTIQALQHPGRMCHTVGDQGSPSFIL